MLAALCWNQLCSLVFVWNVIVDHRQLERYSLDCRSKTMQLSMLVPLLRLSFGDLAQWTWVASEISWMTKVCLLRLYEHAHQYG